jgi:tetratricopeptide (TPR) repeat protein
MKNRTTRLAGLLGALWIASITNANAGSAQDELARATVLGKQGVEKLQQGSYVESERLLREALAIREKYLDAGDVLVAHVENDLGAALYYQSRYSEAELMYHRAAEKFAADPRSIADEVSSLANLASLYREQRRIPEADAIYKRLFQTFRDPSAVNEITVAAVLNDYGMFEKTRGNFVKAGEALRRAAEIRERRFPAGHPNIISTWVALADLHYTQHDFASAEALFRKAVDACDESLGAKDRRCAPAMNGLALTLTVRGLEPESEKLFQRALASFEETYGPMHPRVAAVLNNLGTSADRQHDYRRAERYLRRALDVWYAAFGPEHPDVASACSNLASVYMHKRDLKDAEPLYQRALAIDQHVFGPVHAKVALDLNNLAVLYGEMKRYDESHQYFDKAINTLEAMKGPGELGLAGVLVNYAAQMSNLKRLDDAVALYQRALAIYDRNPADETPAVAAAYENYAKLMRKKEEFAEAQKAEASAMRIRVRNTIGNAEIQSSYR